MEAEVEWAAEMLGVERQFSGFAGSSETNSECELPVYGRLSFGPAKGILRARVSTSLALMELVP
jgi:hypothetical protein